MQVVYLLLAAICISLTSAHTMEELRTDPEKFRDVVESLEFNRWYHAGIALVILYALLTGLTSTIVIVSHILGHKPRRFKWLVSYFEFNCLLLDI